MWRLFSFLMTGSWHRHNWAIHKEGTIVDDGTKVGNWYDLRCVECGTIKRVNTSA